MTSSEQKDSMLASVFGDAYKKNPSQKQMKKAISKPKENKKDTSVEKIRIEKGTDESLLKVNRLPNYQTLKNLVIKKSNRLNDIDNQMTDWFHNDHPVIAEVVSHNVARYLENDLKENIVPFIHLKTAKNAIFVVRNCDQNRFQRSVENTIFNLSTVSYMFNYETFTKLNEKAEKPTTFITGLSELQMESIRRKINLKSDGVKFAIFRMNDNKWGIGINTSDFLASFYDTTNKTCFAEALLYTAISLNGVNKDSVITQLQKDIDADRIAAMHGQLSLQKKGQVYIYDPTFPVTALKISKSGYQKTDIIKSHGKISLKDSPVVPFNESVSDYFYRNILAGMNHKAYVYNTQELLMVYDQWKHRDLRKERNNIAQDFANHKLAHQLYLAFAEEHQKDPIFTKNGNIEKQVATFKNEVASVLDSLSKSEISLYYSDEKGIEMFNVLSSAQYDLNYLHNAAADMHSFDIRAIRDNTRENYISLNEQLKNMRANIPTMKDFERNY